MTVALALVTCPTASADALARALVESGHAACVNIVAPVSSVYRWQGRVCTDTEALLLIKHRAEAFDALRDAVLAQHPYELPEIIAVDVNRGHAPYLAWVLGASR